MLDFDDMDTYTLLIQVCDPYGVEPSVPIESEIFFRELLTSYTGDNNTDSVRKWLNEQIKEHFISIKDKPKWIQSAEWAFINGKPAIFLGEIDVPLQQHSALGRIFHDDTAFYLFLGEEGETVVVVQQY